MRPGYLALLLLAGLHGVSSAQTCERPHPFDRISALQGTTEFVAGDGASCDLRASLDASGPSVSGGFAWYSVPDRRSTLRIAFTVDTSDFQAQSLLDGAEILAVTSHIASTEPYGNVILHVGLEGAPDEPEPGSTYLNYAAKCGPAGGGACGNLVVGVAGVVHDGDRLAFEIGVGAGADGWIRIWQNADFTDPPTVEIDDLDNGALLGPGDVALGTFNRFAAFQPSEMTLRFSDIETSDDVLFWSGLDD